MPIVRIGDRYDTGGGHRVQLDAGADNSLVVLSAEDGNFLSRLEEDGSETLLAATTSYGNFRSGFVETLSDGRYVLYTTFNFGLGWDARVQILNSDGSPATGIIDPAFEDGSGHTLAGFTLAPTLDGGFAFNWNDISRGSDQFLLTYPRSSNNGSTQTNVSGGNDVRIRFFDANADAATASIVADDDVETLNGATVNRRAASQGLQDSATLANGQTAFVFEDQRYVGSSPEGGAHVELQLSLQISSPNDVGEPIKIDLDPFGPNSSQPRQFLNAGTGANIVALPDGTFAVIWTQSVYTASDLFDGTSTVIRYFDAAGTALTDPIEIVRRGTEHGNHSKYVWGEALPDGRIAIAYNVGLDGVNGNGTLDAFVGVIGPLGSSIEVQQVNPAAQNTQIYSIQDLAVRTDGTIELAYRDASAGTNGSNRNATVIDRFAVADSGEVVTNGSSGADAVDGGAQQDVIFGADGDDVLTGGGDNDVLNGGGGNDMLDGGDGDDRVAGGAGDDRVDGGAGADSLRGGDGNDRIGGQAGDDAILGGAGGDGLFGDAGNDRIQGGASDDYLSGGSGNDGLAGDDGNDFLTADEGDDRLDGGAGADALHGGTGNDRIGGQGDDDYGDGGAGGDGLFGDAGNDRLRGGAANDYVSGGIGNDALYGDADDDFLTAGDGEDYLDGGLGNDQLHGGAGDDRLAGKDGDDYLDGSGGADGLFGDAGLDRLRGGSGDDYLSGGIGNDALYGDADNDFLAGGDGNDYLDGGLGADAIHGGIGTDLILARDGDDYVDAGDGSDNVAGGAGDDQLLGGAGNDIVTGGMGADALDGGAGADSFRYIGVEDSAPDAIDTIAGFLHLTDEIDLSRIDANEGAAGNQGFTLIGDQAFTGSGGASAGQLRAFRVEGSVGNIWQVEGDTDGDGDADFVIRVDMSNADPLTATDFVL